MHEDAEYLELVSHILDDDDFKKLQNFLHHGVSRYEHSLKVSYQAYKYAKKHNLNYKEVAVGGLLHDFFENTSDPTMKERFITTFRHSNIAEYNATKKFNVNQMEADIIGSHMFPINKRIPKYKESWLVSLYDKKVCFSEFSNKCKYQMSCLSNLFALFLLNSIK